MRTAVPIHESTLSHHFFVYEYIWGCKATYPQLIEDYNVINLETNENYSKRRVMGSLSCETEATNALDEFAMMEGVYFDA